MKTLINTLAMVGLFAIMWECAHALHDRTCTGRDCDWFWCDSYSGK